MKNKKCLYSNTYGIEKENEGTFVEFANQVITDDGGNKFANTMAIIKKEDGHIIMVEPSCIQIIEEKELNNG